MTAIRSSFRTRAIASFAVLGLVLGLGALVPDTSARPNDGERARWRQAHDREHGHEHTVGEGDKPHKPARGDARQVEPVETAIPTVVAETAADEVVDPVHMEVLVLAATGDEPELGAITQQLEILGTPYEVMKMAPRPSDPAADRLYNELSDWVINAYYQGVILTDAALTYESGGSWQSALTPAEWTTLRNYEHRWNIREVSWNGWPDAEHGFGPTTGSTCTGNLSGTNSWCRVAPIQARYGPAAAEVFGSYANLDATVPIENSWVNRAPALADGDSQPLLLDEAGNSLGVLRRHRAADGTVARQSVTLTFANNQYELSSAVLGYGLVNWVTKGMFLGERHVYLGAQVDDVFLSGAIWEEGTPCGTSFDLLPSYRMTGADWNAFVQWQRVKRNDPMTADLMVAMAYNGLGTDPEWFQGYLEDDTVGGDTEVDTLLPAVRATQHEFEWISHTWSHQNLDWLQYPKPAPGTPFSVTKLDTLDQLQRNHDVAVALGLSRYRRVNLVTPEVSGLRNPEAIAGMWEHGVRNVVSDTSRGRDEANSSFNAGNPNPIHPGIYMVPRRPVNLYYNVSTPEEWLAEDNCMYPPGVYGHVGSYDALLEREATVLVGYMLRGDIDPWMFHANNLRDYDGQGHSLLSDLLDRVLQKYRTYFTLPVQTLTMDEIARSMVDRNRFEHSGASGRFVPMPPDSSPGAITIATVNAATIPVTGLLGANGETYGNQLIARVALPAGGEHVFNDGSTPPPPPGEEPPAGEEPTQTSPVTAVSFTPEAMTFAARAVNTTSGSQAVVVQNTGNTSVTIGSVAVTGAHAADFGVTNGCPTSLAAGSACSVGVRFTPKASGTRTASLGIATSARSATISLTGTGVAPNASVTPLSIAFGSIRRNQLSTWRPVTVSNTGNAPMSIAVSLRGSNPGQFKLSNGCPASLGAGASCTVNVRFAPTSRGTKTADLRVATNAPQKTITVTLSGTGT